jgi:hypothetical protein
VQYVFTCTAVEGAPGSVHVASLSIAFFAASQLFLLAYSTRVTEDAGPLVADTTIITIKIHIFRSDAVGSKFRTGLIRHLIVSARYIGVQEKSIVR